MIKRHYSRKNLLASVIATTLASTAGMPSISWAQSADATLRGQAAANSDVTARNVNTGASRRTKADAEGAYVLVGLPPGTYNVDAGPGTAQTVTLTVASTATLDLTPAGAAPTTTLASVEVSGRRLVETRTSEVGVTISPSSIATVPQITRNFLEFADTVPGVVFSVDPSGNTSLRGGAMSTSAVNVYIDGIGQKNYVKEGGVSGQFFTQGNPFPQLGIGEYKVITSNYKAEFDQVSSAAVIAQTKSGTNEFHGEVFGTYTKDHFRAETPAELAANKKTPSKTKEYGVSLGGPIIQNQMHFFLTYEAKRYDTPVTVTPGVLSINGIPINNLLPANVVSQFGPGTLPFTENLYFGKIDWEPSDADRFEVSAKYRQEDLVQNIGNAQAASASIDTKNDDLRIEGRWQRSADRWFNELIFTYEDSFNSPVASNNGNGAVYAIHSQNDRNIVTTAAADPRATQNKGQRGPGIQDDLTFSDLRWMGLHTLKMGAKFKEVTLRAQDAGVNNPQFFYDVEATGTSATPYKALFPNPVPGLSPIAKSKDQQFGVYFQDDWAANDHLILNLGVRWDYEKTPSYLNYTTPANVIAALNGPDPNAPGQTYAHSLALGGVNVSDYISNGHNREAYKGEIQPRVGFSYDLNADQRHVIFGGAGRSYDRDLYDYLQLELTKSALPLSTVYFDPPMNCVGQPCFAWDPKYLNGVSNLQSLVGTTNRGNEVDMLNNHLKAPYSDQFSVGMRNRLGDWNTSATVARILSYDGFVFTLGNRYPNGAFWMNGGQPWGNGVPGFGALIIGNNGIETKTTEVLLSADKPFTKESRWGASVAYTWTGATQNRSITEHYSFDQETIKQYPFITSNAAPKHRLVTTGTFQAPWDIIIAAKITLASPTPVNDIAFPGLQPNGSSNVPIAGTPKETLGFRSLDLQVTKDFKIADTATIYVRIDLLNAFNYYNYSDTFNNWVGPGGQLASNPVTYNPNGNITGVPRTFRLTLGGKF